MPRFWARTVILDGGAASSHHEAEHSFHRFDEAFEGLERMLARNPKIGRRMGVNEGSPWMYSQGGDDAAGTPVISVIYTFDIDEVTIRSIHVTQVS